MNTDLYSRTSTNGHHSTTDTALKRPLFFFSADSPFIDSCLNLTTTAIHLMSPSPGPNNLSANSFISD